MQPHSILDSEGEQNFFVVSNNLNYIRRLMNSIHEESNEREYDISMNHRREIGLLMVTRRARYELIESNYDCYVAISKLQYD